MVDVFDSRNRLYRLVKEIKSGGEGKIYTISNNPGFLAKIYFHPNKQLEKKLTYMILNPPKDVSDSVAWPMNLLYDANKRFIGFLMPKLNAKTPLKDIYSYDLSCNPTINYQERVIIAINICVVIEAVHKAGYIFGDFNPLNIGINIVDGTVGFFDVDSYHFKDKDTNDWYRCNVACSGFVAPELLKRIKGTTLDKINLPTFTIETDNFALAIHIFRLLMNGFSPFSGINENANVSTASPGDVNEAVTRNNYCFKKGKKPQSYAIPNINEFPIEFLNLFQLAFVDGHLNSNLRPDASTWQKALKTYHSNLVRCNKNSSHYYYRLANGCPYCEADKHYIDMNSNASVIHITRVNNSNKKSNNIINKNYIPPIINSKKIINSNLISLKKSSFIKRIIKKYKKMCDVLIIAVEKCLFFFTEYSRIIAAYTALFCVIGGIVAIGVTPTIVSCINNERYNIKHFNIDINDFSSESEDYLEYCFNCSLSFKNDSDMYITNFVFSLVFEDEKYDEIAFFYIQEDCVIEKKCTSEIVKRCGCIKDKKSAVLYKGKYRNFAYKYKINSIRAGGQDRQYINEYIYLHNPFIKEKYHA